MSVTRRIRYSASGALLLLLLAASGLGAEEQSPIPRAIVGGEPAAVESYPFVVCVNSTKNRCCTGSIIAPNWVLTSAHCFSRPGIRLTATQIEHGYGSSYGWTTRNSKRIILHPQYRVESYADYNDIALVELSESFPAAYVAPLGIPTRAAEQRHAISGVSAIFLGYGFKENNLHSDGMRSVNINLYYAEDCRTNRFFARFMHSDVLCAGSSTKRGNNGDSGGPLIVPYTDNNNTKYLQIGVAQQIAMTGSEGTTIFARVSSFSSWIKTTTDNAVSPIDVKKYDATKLLNQLTQTEAQILSLQGTVRSLQSNRDKLKGLIDQIKGVDGQTKALQAKTDGVLRSASTILAE